MNKEVEVLYFTQQGVEWMFPKNNRFLFAADLAVKNWGSCEGSKNDKVPIEGGFLLRTHGQSDISKVLYRNGWIDKIYILGEGGAHFEQHLVGLKNAICDAMEKIRSSYEDDFNNPQLV